LGLLSGARSPSPSEVFRKLHSGFSVGKVRISINIVTGQEVTALNWKRVYLD